jgi:hypothetical protein
MAGLFEGRHQRSGQRVAVKVLAMELARNPEVVQRFDREARAVGAPPHAPCRARPRARVDAHRCISVRAVFAGASLGVLALVGAVLTVLSLSSTGDASTTSGAPSSETSTDMTTAPAASSNAAPMTTERPTSTAEPAPSEAATTAPVASTSTSRRAPTPAARPRRDAGAAAPSPTPTAEPTTNPTLLSSDAAARMRPRGGARGSSRASHPSVRRLRSTVASLVLGLVVLGGPSPVLGADADTERARALFDEAGELERRGRWRDAQERLRAALRLREMLQLHYALGWALENDDNLLEATDAYVTAARLGRERRDGAEVTRLSSLRFATVEREMPVLRVRIRGGPARVVVDGREVPREGGVASAHVNPGSHVIRVERHGRGAVEQIDYVGRSAVRTIEIADADFRTALKPIRSGTQASRSKGGANAGRDEPVLPWLLLSGGVALLVGGGALVVSAGDDAERRDVMHGRWCAAVACTGARPARTETAEAASWRREAEDAAATSSAKQAAGLSLGGLGLLTATVGILALITGDESSKDTTTRAKASAAPLPGGAHVRASFLF